MWLNWPQKNGIEIYFAVYHLYVRLKFLKLCKWEIKYHLTARMEKQQIIQQNIHTSHSQAGAPFWIVNFHRLAFFDVLQTLTQSHRIIYNYNYGWGIAWYQELFRPSYCYLSKRSWGDNNNCVNNSWYHAKSYLVIVLLCIQKYCSRFKKPNLFAQTELFD